MLNDGLLRHDYRSCAVSCGIFLRILDWKSCCVPGIPILRKHLHRCSKLVGSVSYRCQRESIRGGYAKWKSNFVFGFKRQYAYGNPHIKTSLWHIQPWWGFWVNIPQFIMWTIHYVLVILTKSISLECDYFSDVNESKMNTNLK